MNAESAVYHLTCLLHYHERVMSGVTGEMAPDGTMTEVSYGRLYDGYADALREAIRCIKQVNCID